MHAGIQRDPTTRGWSIIIFSRGSRPQSGTCHAESRCHCRTSSPNLPYGISEKAKCPFFCSLLKHVKHRCPCSKPLLLWFFHHPPATLDDIALNPKSTTPIIPQTCTFPLSRFHFQGQFVGELFAVSVPRVLRSIVRYVVCPFTKGACLGGRGKGDGWRSEKGGGSRFSNQLPQLKQRPWRDLAHPWGGRSGSRS
jgi:hypothetical protein